jgi:thiosulfate dehydrogenase [quinone] large subunit
MWSALLPPENNPFIDEHIIYATLFIFFALSNDRPGQCLGLGGWWSETQLVKKYPFLA